MQMYAPHYLGHLITFIIVSAISGCSAPSGPSDQRIGTVKLMVNTGDSWGPAINEDGIIYVSGAFLTAIAPDGTVLWQNTETGYINTVSVISDDGTIYVGGEQATLFAITPNGSIRWQVQLGDKYLCNPAVATDGTVYVISNSGPAYVDLQEAYLNAVDFGGNLLWRFKIGGRVNMAPVIALDGTIYIGSNYNLYAFHPSGVLKWSYQSTLDLLDGSPAIGSDGTIYLCTMYNDLHAINIDGTNKWTLRLPSSITSPPVIGPNGNIYVGCWGRMCAISTSGSLIWQFDVDHEIRTTPAVGNDGTIYFGTCFVVVDPIMTGNVDRTFYLYALNANGTLQWKLPPPAQSGYGPPQEDGSCSIFSSPAIGADGTLWFGYGQLLGVYSRSRGLADSSWPKFRGNNQNSGRR